MKIRIYYNEKKLKEPYLSLFNEYKKRISPYAKLELVTGFKNKIAGKDDFRILISEHSNPISSEELAERIKFLNLNSYTNIGIYLDGKKEGKDLDFALIVGGISNEMLISVIVEQLYRAFSIIHNKSYHK